MQIKVFLFWNSFLSSLAKCSWSRQLHDTCRVACDPKENANQMEPAVTRLLRTNIRRPPDTKSDHGPKNRDPTAYATVVQRIRRKTKLIWSIVVGGRSFFQSHTRVFRWISWARTQNLLRSRFLLLLRVHLHANWSLCRVRRLCRQQQLKKTEN